jgi:hypothetical protein
LPSCGGAGTFRGGGPGKYGQHPPPTCGQLRSQADGLKDHGVPMAGVSKVMGLTVEVVEELLQSLRCRR